MLSIRSAFGMLVRALTRKGLSSDVPGFGDYEAGEQTDEQEAQQSAAFLKEYGTYLATTATAVVLTVAVVALGGGVRLICLSGLLCLMSLYGSYVEIGEHAKSRVYSVVDRPNHLLLVAALAGFMKLLQSFDTYLVLDRADTVLGSIYTFPWSSVLPYFILPLIVALVARQHMRTLLAPHFSGRFVVFMFGAGFIFNVYLFVSGLFGAEAFEAARPVLTLPDLTRLPTAIATAFTVAPDSAYRLYQLMGSWIFYFLFIGIPCFAFLLFGVFLCAQLIRRLKKETTQYFSEPVRSALVARVWILALGMAVSRQNGDLNKVYYGWLHLGHPIDAELYRCEGSNINDPDHKLTCEETAASEWRAEVERREGEADARLDEKGRAASLRENHVWKVNTDKDLARFEGNPLQKAERAITLYRQRVSQLASRTAR